MKILKSLFVGAALVLAFPLLASGGTQKFNLTVMAGRGEEVATKDLGDLDWTFEEATAVEDKDRLVKAEKAMQVLVENMKRNSPGEVADFAAYPCLVSVPGGAKMLALIAGKTITTERTVFSLETRQGMKLEDLGSNVTRVNFVKEPMVKVWYNADYDPPTSDEVLKSDDEGTLKVLTRNLRMAELLDKDIDASLVMNPQASSAPAGGHKRIYCIWSKDSAVGKTPNLDSFWKKPFLAVSANHAGIFDYGTGIKYADAKGVLTNAAPVWIEYNAVEAILADYKSNETQGRVVSTKYQQHA